MPKGNQTARSVRDAAKPANYYGDCIELLGKQVQQAIDIGPRMLSAASEYSLRAAKAAYSAGEPVTKSRRFLLDAVRYWKQYLREGSGGVVRGIVRVDTFVETLAASSLLDDAKDAIGTFKSVFSGEQSPHWHKAIASLATGTLTGSYAPPTELDLKALAAARQFSAVPALCKAVVTHDNMAFGEALEEYLRKGWGPVADRAAKGDLQQSYPVYVGKWSLFAAALCRLAGSVPDLSKKAQSYVPFELVGPE